MKPRLRGPALAEIGQRLFFGPRLRGSVPRGYCTRLSPIYGKKQFTSSSFFMKTTIFYHILKKNERFRNHLQTDNEENMDFVKETVLYTVSEYVESLEQCTALEFVP